MNGTDWTTIITIIGANIALFSWLRSDMKSFENKIETKIDEFKDQINKEMKDFHGRLERQDAEFKGRMEKQDAEFKAHILYRHPEKK